MPTFNDRLIAAVIVWFLSLLALIPTGIGGGLGFYALLGVLMASGGDQPLVYLLYAAAVGGFFAWLLLTMASQTPALKPIGDLRLKSSVTACTLGYMVFGVVASQTMTRSFGSRYSHWLLLTLVSPFALAGTYLSWPLPNTTKAVAITAGIGAMITTVVVAMIYST